MLEALKWWREISSTSWKNSNLSLSKPHYSITSAKAPHNFCEDPVGCGRGSTTVRVASGLVLHQRLMLPNELLGNLGAVKLQLQSSSDGILQLSPGFLRSSGFENMEVVIFQWQGKKHRQYMFHVCFIECHGRDMLTKIFCKRHGMITWRYPAGASPLRSHQHREWQRSVESMLRSIEQQVSEVEVTVETPQDLHHTSNGSLGPNIGDDGGNLQ